MNWPTIKPIKKRRPLGPTTPWAWVIEPVHGCNLRCGHCSCRLLPRGEFQYMSEGTWATAWQILNHFSPTCRVDLALAGEPSLHPGIVEFVSIARRLAPFCQIQMTTNGTALASGKLRYDQLFGAGLNVCYVDMYAPKETHVRLAEESGYPHYPYYEKPKSAPSPWTFWGPHLKVIVLQEQPANWPASRRRAGLLGTWYNHLDWNAAAAFDLKPVAVPPRRRCNQPFIYVPVHFSGAYLLCCQDNWGETAGSFGSVGDGLDGFLRYWYGHDLQAIRRRLRQKDRAGTSQCSRCAITFSRCDFKHWTDEQVGSWWDGKAWRPMEAWQ